MSQEKNQRDVRCVCCGKSARVVWDSPWQGVPAGWLVRGHDVGFEGSSEIRIRYLCGTICLGKLQLSDAIRGTVTHQEKVFAARLAREGGAREKADAYVAEEFGPDWRTKLVKELDV